MTNEQKCASQRQQILDAAARLFSERGFGGTGMREIAKEAGVSLSMVNYHFGTKACLLEMAVASFQDDFLTMARAALTGNDTLEAKVRAYVRGSVQLARERPHFMRVAFHDLPKETPTMPNCKSGRLKELPVLLKEHMLGPAGKGPLLHFLGPGIGKMIMSHFVVRPMVEAILGPMPDDDAFYETYADAMADQILYGLVGQRGVPADLASG